MNPVETLEKAKATASPEVVEEIVLALEAGTLEDQEALAARLVEEQGKVPVPVAPVERKPSRKTLCELKRRARGKVNAPPEARQALQAVKDEALDALATRFLPLYCGECRCLRVGERGIVCKKTKANRKASDKACASVEMREARTEVKA